MAYYKDFGFKVQEFTYRKIYKLGTEDPSKKKKKKTSPSILEWTRPTCLHKNSLK